MVINKANRPAIRWNLVLYDLNVLVVTAFLILDVILMILLLFGESSSSKFKAYSVLFLGSENVAVLGVCGSYCLVNKKMIDCNW